MTCGLITDTVQGVIRGGPSTFGGLRAGDCPGPDAWCPHALEVPLCLALMPARTRYLQGLMHAPSGAALAVALAVPAMLLVPDAHSTASSARSRPRRDPIHLIRNVVIVMQENRSFDNYFGTFPGADGIPMRHGLPVPCLRDPARRRCQRPYHDPSDRNVGASHNHWAHDLAVNGGRMDGFIRVYRRKRPAGPQDVMGYHDAREIPNYWTYARRFVLQDHMFEPTRDWSFAEHLYLVSEWAAACRHRNRPMSCVNRIHGPPDQHHPRAAWTDLTYLLHRHKVSWRYYVFRGREPDCVSDEALTCTPPLQSSHTLSLWNPLPGFATVRHDHQLAQRAIGEPLLRRGARRAPAARRLGHPEQPRLRTPAGVDRRRAGLRDQRDQRRHAQPAMAACGGLHLLGRLGRLL